MELKILLPFGVFTEKSNVASLVAYTKYGSLGILPRRLDCMSVLVPGILSYVVDGQSESYIAVDEGVLIKTGACVRVSVRNAISGSDLTQLREDVEKQFLNLSEEETISKLTMAKMETGFISRLAEFQRG